MRNDLLDFESEEREKGYMPFCPSAENFKKNIGRKICYVNYLEPYRGTYYVRYGMIHSVKRNTLYLEDGHLDVDIKKILQAGIKIEQ